MAPKCQEKILFHLRKVLYIVVLRKARPEDNAFNLLNLILQASAFLYVFFENILQTLRF